LEGYYETAIITATNVYTPVKRGRSKEEVKAAPTITVIGRNENGVAAALDPIAQELKSRLSEINTNPDILVTGKYILDLLESAKSKQYYAERDELSPGETFLKKRPKLTQLEPYESGTYRGSPIRLQMD